MPVFFLGDGRLLRDTRGCVSHWWALLNEALCSITHPSCTSNIGPTARVFSCYVNVVHVGLWVVFPQADGRPLVVLVNGQHDVVFLCSSCEGNGSMSSHGNVVIL